MRNHNPKFKIFKILCFLTLFLVFAFSFTSIAEAAILKLVSPNNKLSLGQEMKVNLIIDTENEQINAIGGKIIFSSEIFGVTEIKDGNSIINLWTERPEVDENGAITFSGIIPGGVNMQNGLLFSVVLKAKKEGTGALAIQNAEVLKNDGLGTPAKVGIFNFQFSISPPDWLGQPNKESLIKDTEPPEDFNPIIGSDPSIFDGKYFLVFAAQDKSSGLDHYEVREGFWDKYVAAESPYLLKNQSLDEKIYIKAVDRAQNERTATFKPDQWKWYRQYVLLGIMLILIIAGGFVFKRIWLRK